MDRAPRAPERRKERLGWLVAPVSLAATVGAFFLVKAGPVWIFGWVLAGIFAVIAGWILLSVLWPAKADRACPACGAESVGRADEATSIGLHCTACGWHDEASSSWLLAEEEDKPLEPLVLRQRGRVDITTNSD